QVLSGMCQRLELAVAEEPARPLDGVNGAEHAGQRVDRRRILFQGDEVSIEAVEGLVTFPEKLADHLVHVVQSSAPRSRRATLTLQARIGSRAVLLRI